MSAGIFDEYLVRLGFDSDPAGYAKFKATLADASATVSHHTSKIIKDIFAIQTGIVGGFAAIDGGILGLADRVADADLGFQLYATRMYMTVGAAKSLKVATDALGYSLNEIAWNPELLHRFEALEVLQSTLSKQMDPDFEKNLQGIRDLGFEMTKLRVEGEYIASNVVSQLFKGLDGEGALKKLEDVDTWVTSHLPEITQFFTQHLIPVFKDGEAVIGGTVSVLKDLALTFTNLVGDFSFDSSIESSTFSMEKFATAIDKVANGLSTVVGWIISGEKTILDSVNLIDHLGAKGDRRALLLADSNKSENDESPGGWAAIAASMALGYGAFELALYAKRGLVSGIAAVANLANLAGRGAGATAGAEAAAGAEATTAAEVTAGAAAAGAAGSLVGGLIPVAGVGLVLGTLVNSYDKTQSADNLRKFVGGVLGLDLTDAGASRRDDELKRFFHISTGSSSSASSTPAGSIHDLIESLAPQFGVSPILAHAMAKQESGERQYGSDGSLIMSGVGPNGGAKGVFQLEDSAARQYGVNSLDPAGNITGGLHYIADLLKKYNGNTEEALAAYNWGPGRVDDLVKRRGGFDASYLPPDVQKYIASIESRMMGGDIHITNQIYASPNANPQEIGRQASDQTVAQIRALTRRQNTTTTAMLGSSYQ